MATRRPSSFTGRQFLLDFIICDECWVAWMSNCQQVPVAQQTTPWLKQPAINIVPTVQSSYLQTTLLTNFKAQYSFLILEIYDKCTIIPDSLLRKHALNMHVWMMWHAGWLLTGCSWIMPSPKCSGAHQHAVSTRSQVVPFVSEAQPCNLYPLYATLG